MTDHEFQVAFAPMIAHVGKQPTPEQLRYWHEMLDDLPAETARRAIVAMLRDYQYAGFPPVGLVRKHAGAAVGSIGNADRANIAWLEIKHAIQTHGGYATIEFADPITTAAVRLLGGWPRFCDCEAGEQFDAWLRREFVQTYQTLIQTGVNAEDTQPLPGIIDAANSAAGHDEREPIRLIESRLEPVPTTLIRGERLPTRRIESAVRRIAEKLDLGLPEPVVENREPPLPVEVQKTALRKRLEAR